MTNDPAGDRILRAKYLDWCSARIADRFLELTPDQIYELAHWRSGSDASGQVRPPASRDPSPPLSSSITPVQDSSPPPAATCEQVAPEVLPYPDDAVAAGGAVYLTLVERVAEVLAERLHLPSFEEWATAYRDSPETFEKDLLGLWRSRAGELDQL